MNRVYLTRRNLLSLLSKLDRKAKGEETECTIIKRDTVHPEYPTTVTTAVIAVEDVDYYSDRPAGAVYPADEPPQGGGFVI
jgi:hypothetical protein